VSDSSTKHVYEKWGVAEAKERRKKKSFLKIKSAQFGNLSLSLSLSKN
jgi:hypothetical protein